MKTSFVTPTGAALLERDRQTVVRALRGTKPDRIEGKRKLYRWKVIFDKMLEHERGTIEAGKAITDEHRLLAKARREKIERENEVAAGRLLDIESDSAALEQDYRTITERLLSIAAEVADRVEPIDVARHEVIRQAVHDRLIIALNELAAPAMLFEKVHGKRITEQTNGEAATLA
jgi:hypothetical protein